MKYEIETYNGKFTVKGERKRIKLSNNEIVTVGLRCDTGWWSVDDVESGLAIYIAKDKKYALEKAIETLESYIKASGSVAKQREKTLKSLFGEKK